MSLPKIYAEHWKDYELIDAGGGKKLERWGDVITIRPELQAYFHSGLPYRDWAAKAHFEFVQGQGQKGKWKQLKKLQPAPWTINYKSLKFQLELTQFKHVGLFPEQQTNWDFIEQNINSESRLLNLFAYTGAMSCVSRNKGAETLHVDSVKQLITWASTNMELSRLMNIKWVHEDALKFINRLVKREEAFDAIVMDPPAWGIGAKNEKWKLEDKIDALLGAASQVLSADGVLVLNTYSPKIEGKLLSDLAELYFPTRNKSVSELWMKTTTGKELYFGNLLRIKSS